MGVIVLNSLVIGFETVEEWKEAHTNAFKALDEFFLAIYTMEFLMKLYAEPRGYWKSSYNRFDFSILALSYVQVIMDELNVGDKILTPLRLLRGICQLVFQILIKLIYRGYDEPIKVKQVSQSLFIFAI